MLVARSWNGSVPNLSENNDEAVDDTLTPCLSIDFKKNCEAGAVRHRS